MITDSTSWAEWCDCRHCRAAIAAIQPVECEGFREELARLAKRPWAPPELREVSWLDLTGAVLARLALSSFVSPSEMPAPGHLKLSPSPPE